MLTSSSDKSTMILPIYVQSSGDNVIKSLGSRLELGFGFVDLLLRAFDLNDDSFRVSVLRNVNLGAGISS